MVATEPVTGTVSSSLSYSARLVALEVRGPTASGPGAVAILAGNAVAIGVGVLVAEVVGAAVGVVVADAAVEAA